MRSTVAPTTRAMLSRTSTGRSPFRVVDRVAHITQASSAGWEWTGRVHFDRRGRRRCSAAAPEARTGLLAALEQAALGLRGEVLVPRTERRVVGHRLAQLAQVGVVVVLVGGVGQDVN